MILDESEEEAPPAKKAAPAKAAAKTTPAKAAPAKEESDDDDDDDDDGMGNLCADWQVMWLKVSQNIWLFVRWPSPWASRLGITQLGHC